MPGDRMTTADGVKIKQGDTVWVAEFDRQDPGVHSWVVTDDDFWEGSNFSEDGFSTREAACFALMEWAHQEANALIAMAMCSIKTVQAATK